MASDPTRPILDEALSLLGQNRPQEALTALDRIGDQGREIPDQVAYRGLALAKLGDGMEGLRLLRSAVNMAPSEPRYRLLLAAQLSEMGDTDGAKREAAEAARLDPKFPGLGQLYVSLGLDPSTIKKQTLRQVLFAPPLASPAYGQFHAFPALSQASRQWTAIGWVLVILNVIVPIAFWLHLPFHLPAAHEPRGLPFLAGYVMNSDLLSLLSVFLFIAVSILCVAWTFTDVLDRRARAVWLVPMIPFCCLCGLPGVAQALYMSLGRK